MPDVIQAMQSIGDIFRKKRGGIDFGQLAQLHRIRQHWPQLVGPVFAQQSHVAMLKAKVLTIWVEHAAWMSEMEFLKPELIKKIKSLTGVSLDEIKCRVGPQPAKLS